MKLLKITAKCSDMFSAFLEEDGTRTPAYDGYVPNFMPGNHYGDYVMLDIDAETGMILNWKKPSLEKIKEELRGV